MTNVRVDQDIRPLSEFRANAATFMQQLKESRRPMVLTQHGRGVAVMMDVHEFERMQERLSILEDINRAEEQLDAGQGVLHAVAKKQVLDSLNK